MEHFVKAMMILLSTVTMENGEGSVPQSVGGILISQWLFVHNWAIVTLGVS